MSKVPNDLLYSLSSCIEGLSSDLLIKACGTPITISNDNKLIFTGTGEPIVYFFIQEIVDGNEYCIQVSGSYLSGFINNNSSNEIHDILENAKCIFGYNQATKKYYVNLNHSDTNKNILIEDSDLQYLKSLIEILFRNVQKKILSILPFPDFKISVNVSQLEIE